MSTPSILRVAAPALLAASLIAGCQAASGSAPSATRPPTAAPAPTVQAATPFAAWTARQGFGGGSGLVEIGKGAHWLRENVGASDAASWASWWNGTATNLASWLEQHEPTSCWAEYHAAVSAGMARALADLAAIQAALDAGKSLPLDASDAFVTEADALEALRPPANCP